MSDTPQGVDWWLASDGRWYPPTSRPVPSAPPAPPAPPAPTMVPEAPNPAWQYAAPQPNFQQSPAAPPGWTMVPVGYAPPPPPPAPGLSKGLSIAVQVLFWIEVGLAAIASIAFAAVFSSFEMMRKPSATLAAWQRWSDQADIAAGFLAVFIFAQIPIMVLLIIWTFKSHRSATLLEPGRRRWAIGWTIGSWFIPLATYVLPFLVIRETDAIASAPRVAGKVVSNWREYRRPSALGTLWWVLFVLMTVLFLIRPSIWPDDVDEGRVRAFYIVSLILLAVGAASAALGALYIRSVSRRLSPQAIASGAN